MIRKTLNDFFRGLNLSSEVIEKIRDIRMGLLAVKVGASLAL